jgi:hypothetical protein
MTTTYTMRVNPDELLRWKAAARRAELGLSAWIRAIVDVAAADGDEEQLLFARPAPSNPEAR